MPRTHDADAKGWMYFIASDAQKAVKIGFATDVYQRLKTLQSGNPDRLRVMGSVPALLGAETHLHRILKARAIRLEWYPLSGFMEALTDELQDIVLDSAFDIMDDGIEGTGDPESASTYVNSLREMFPLTPEDVDRALQTTLDEYVEDEEDEAA